MGVFDFVRDVGAKIGIGKSTAEIEAEEKAEATKRGLEAQAKMAAKSQADRAKEAASAAKEKAAEAKATAAKKAAAATRRRKVAAKRRFEAYKRSNELEDYVMGLGLAADDVDIRYENGTAYIEGEVPDQETREKIILAVGNAEGVGRVNEEMTVAEPADEAVFHTVASGDTLWAIADKVYGDGNRYPEIFEANKPMLTDPDKIFPGQVLRCPK